MNQEEYLSQRVDDQINWYDKKSMINQKRFKRLRIIEIIFAALIPLLSGYTDTIHELQYVLGILGCLVAVIAGLLGLSKYQENWIEYRTTCESLKHEKFLFLTQSSPYHSTDAFQLFVNQVESLISTENSKWSQHIIEKREEIDESKE
jgi:hypothetical protein